MMDEDKTREQLLAELTALRQQAADLTDNQHQLESQCRQLAEAEQEQRIIATALQETGAALSSSLKGEQVLDSVLEQLERVLSHDAACVLLIDGSIVRVFRWRGYVRAGWASQTEIAAAAFNLDSIPVLREARQTGRPLLVSRPPATDEWVRKFGKSWVKSYACAPIRSRGQVIGYLTIDSATPSFFKSSHLEPLQAFANQAALALENVRLYDQTRRERLNQIKALKKERNLISQVLDTTAVLVVVLDEQGRISWLNQAVEQCSGYLLAEVQGKYFWELLVPEEIAQTRSQFTQRAAEKSDLKCECQLLTSSGQRRPIAWTGANLHQQAEPDARLVMTGLDLTERMRAEAALRENEANLRAFFNTIDHLLFVLDSQGRIIWNNETVTHRLGYTEAELRDQNVLMVHPPERRDEAGRIVQEMLTGQADYCPVPVQTKDGRQIPVETRVIKGQWSGQEVIFGVTKDLSALKASEEKFAKAFQSSPMLMAISELGTGRYLEVNEAFLRTLGFQRHEIIGHSSRELELFVRSEQRHAALQLLQEQGYVRDFEVLVRARSGEVREGLFSVEYIQLQDRPMLLTVMNDITKRKQMEHALRESEERLELFFTQSLDGFFFMMLDEPLRWDDTVDKEAALDYIFDHHRLTKVNRAMLAQYGLTAAEMLGLTPRDFFTHDLAHGRQVWHKLFDQGQLHIETEERRADGSQMWIEGDYICLNNQEGQITGHFGIQRDVTARVQAEEEREKLIAELQVALAEIKTLRGIVPICASCKKIRDDEGYWHDVVTYVRERTEAEFTHGICPDCAKKLYPEFYGDIYGDK